MQLFEVVCRLLTIDRMRMSLDWKKFMLNCLNIKSNFYAQFMIFAGYATLCLCDAKIARILPDANLVFL